MTIPYAKPRKTNFKSFLYSIFRWRGSVYRLIWIDLLFFMTIHTIIAVTYILLDYKSQDNFRKVAQYFTTNIAKVPLSFLIGFYVSQVVTRFYMQFNTLPYPYQLSKWLIAGFQGGDETSLMYRRTIMRYSCAAFVVVMRTMCVEVANRFPTLQSIVDTNLLTKNELKKLENYKMKGTFFPVLFLWSMNLVIKARKEGVITSDFMAIKLVNELNDLRGNYGQLLSYDFTNLPLCYTQIVELARHIFCINCWLSRYNFGSVGTAGDSYFPFLTIVQFFIYTGWIRVGTSLLNPFGLDDDDFEVNLFIDRILIDGLTCVDDVFKSTPDLMKDVHWGLVDFELPYTEESFKTFTAEYLGSAGATSVKTLQQNIVQIDLPEKNLEVRISLTSRPQRVSIIFPERDPNVSTSYNSDDNEDMIRDREGELIILATDVDKKQTADVPVKTKAKKGDASKDAKLAEQ